MIFMASITEFILGRGWANGLVTEPKDDNWSYGINQLFLFGLILFTLLYIIIVALSSSPSTIDLYALGLSILILIGAYIAFDYESKNENSKGVGFVGFGSQFKFAIQILAGLAVTMAFIIFLGQVYCSDQNYIREGYCVRSGSTQQFILPVQSLLDPRLAQPFYSVIDAPATEELFFRNFMFYSLLAILPTRFNFFKNLKIKYPILLFLTVFIVVNTAFALWHVVRTQSTCSDTFCFARKLWVSNIYSGLWILGNQLTGGWGFGLAGHILNNYIGTQVSIPDFILYIVIPIIVIVYTATLILGLFKRRR